MRRLLTSGKVLFVAMMAMVAFAGTANAGTLTLRLTDLDTANVVTITDDLAGDSSLTTGLIVWSGTVGNFTINATIGSSKPVVGPGALSLTSFNVSNGALGSHHLMVELSDINFSVPSGNQALIQSITNNTLLSPGGSLVANGYQSNTNGLFNYGGLATTTASIGSGIVGTDVKTSASANFVPLYSLSEKVVLTINGAGSANWTADLKTVPEPASLLLLGGGLLALRRKLRKKVSA